MTEKLFKIEYILVKFVICVLLLHRLFHIKSVGFRSGLLDGLSNNRIYGGTDEFFWQCAVELFLASKIIFFNKPFERYHVFF